MNRHYFIRRLLLLPVTWLGISLVVFALLHLSPGGPVDQRLAEWRAQSVHDGDWDSHREVLAHRLGLDRPLAARYATWLANLARGDWGTSDRYGIGVRELVAERAPVSLLVGGTALALAFCFGSLAGLALALTRGKLHTPFAGLFILLHAAPAFTLALALGRIFPKAPLVGAVLSTSAALLAGVALLTRHAVLDALARGFATAARARGLGEWRLATRHAWRHALVPLAGALGPTCSYALAGSVAIETIFDLRGLGSLAYDATLARDYPVLLMLVLGLATVNLVASLAGDWLIARVDPNVDFRSFA